MRSLAVRGLNTELDATQKKFRPAIMARDVFIERPDADHKSFARAAKAVVADDANFVLKEKLHSLGKQGELSRCIDVRWDKTREN